MRVHTHTHTQKCCLALVGREQNWHNSLATNHPAVRVRAGQIPSFYNIVLCAHVILELRLNQPE